MILCLSCCVYVEMFGLMMGDCVWFVDIELLIEIECDFIMYGEEVKFGGGKVICDGMGQLQCVVVDVFDIVIMNVVIFDYWGIVKVDIVIKYGCIVVIGKVGNFDIQLGVMIVIGVVIEVIVGEGLIVIVGGIDMYIYFISLQQIDEVFVLGVMMMFGGGMGLVIGINVMICMLGLWYMEWMLQVVDGWLINFGFLGKGNVSLLQLFVEQIVVGVIGLKLYEDWGMMFVVIDNCLLVVDDIDMQVVIYIDMLNEVGFVELMVVVFKGCMIYMYYIEGVGGGYVFDILKVCGEMNVLLLLINLMCLYMINMFDEYFDMLMVCYYFDLLIVEDFVFVELCICCEMIVVEDILYDFGVLLMLLFDLQVMGCVGEVIICIWQIVYKMKVQCGVLLEDIVCNDNFCVKCYVVKYMINLVFMYGIVYEVGLIELGKWVDFVLWEFVFFGIKLLMIFKGGMIVFVQMGDLNVLILMLQLVYYCEMFVMCGGVFVCMLLIFVLQMVVDVGIVECYGFVKWIVLVCNCCNVMKVDMIYNVWCLLISVDLEIYDVIVDGQLFICELVIVLLMVQCYFLF